MISVFEGTSAEDVWRQVAQAFRQPDTFRIQASRGGKTREILHAAISISDPRQRWILSRLPALNPAFALAEVVWILAGRRDMAFLKHWNKQLQDFVGPGPELHGAYGYRLRRHLCVDQLERAFQALSGTPDTRQVVLQIWDSNIDLPRADGMPANLDIPCNVLSMPKIRDGKLEWLQVIRSNDGFRGLPYNLVQFTCLQEILAGWLNVECGSYNQISDSLHVYDDDVNHVLGSSFLSETPLNADHLALPKEDSDRTFKELEERIEQMIDPQLKEDELEGLATWDTAPQSYRNICTVLVAEALRRRGQTDAAARAMLSCTSPVYQLLWTRWLARTSR